MTVKRTLPFPLPIDCAACTMGLLGTRNPIVVEIGGESYALHPTCLTPGRHRRKDARPLTEGELIELKQGRGGCEEGGQQVGDDRDYPRTSTARATAAQTIPNSNSGTAAGRCQPVIAATRPIPT